MHGECWASCAGRLLHTSHTLRPLSVHCIQLLQALGIFIFSAGLCFNPFIAPACEISRLEDARTRLQTVHIFGPIFFQCYNFRSCLLLTLCALMKILKFRLMPVRKRTQKGLRVSSRLRTFIGRFQVTS